jgi:pimeloyl-ACP methyl ester carboxylesterase
VNDESRELWAERRERNKALRGDGRLLGLSTGFVEREPELAYLYRQILRLNPPHDEDFLAVPADYRGSTHERLAESGVPILYVVGEDDVLAPPRTIEIAASQIPRARLLRVPGAGHSVYYEQPGPFNREVMSFLTELHAPGPEGPA